MRITTLALAALPALTLAEQAPNPLDQFKQQAEHYYTKFQSFLPNPSVHDAVAAAAAKAGGSIVDVLTIENWESTLRAPVTTGKEEWWVLLSGGNKTCFGQCGKVEKAFNESAVAFAAAPSAPHLAYVNCDHQPILCNSWAAGPPGLWIMEVAPKGQKSDVRIVPLNVTSTTAGDFAELYATGSWKEKPVYEGYWHPFDGQLKEFGLEKPVAYATWVFALVPSWLFMVCISFASRTIM